MRHDVILIVAEDVRATKVLPVEGPKGKNTEQEEEYGRGNKHGTKSK